MNAGAVKLVRRYVRTLTTPEARISAAQTLIPAWNAGNHRERGRLRALMERRLAQQEAA